MRDTDLDDLFAEARRDAPLPSADLLARILADAAVEMPRPAGPARAVRPLRRRWGLALFGGGGLLAGLATATIAGIWIGVAQPAPVAEALWRGAAAADPLDSVELVPGYELFASLDTPVEG